MSGKLFWRIYILMTVLAVACIILAGFVSNLFITHHYMETLERELTADATLTGRLVENDLGTNNEKVQAAVRSIGNDLHVRTTVVLKDGTVVGETDQDPAKMENHADRPEIRQALEEGVGHTERPSPTENVPMLYVAVRLGPADQPKGVVRCALPTTQVHSQTAYFTNVILACSGLGVVLALLVSILISLRISRPIAHMTKVAADIAAGNLERKAHVRSHDELERLAAALNAMRATLVEQITTIERDRRQLDTIISAMSEGVVAIDADERVLFLNEAAAEAFDTARAGAVGKMLWEISRNPALAEFLAKSRGAASPRTFEWSLQDGKARHYELTIVPLGVTASARPAEKGAALPARILVFHDVTALRKLERMRIDFIANVSHELKSPLTSIKGFVETLREGALKDPAKAAEFLEIVHRQTERLDRLVADLLELSTIEAPGYVPDKQAVSLADVANKITENLAQRISGKRLRVEVRAEGEIPPVRADRTRMEQVFMNLLDNAVKYTDPGGSITVSMTREDGSVKTVVRDTGIGIPSKDLPRIFERFYRVDKARSREMGGTGLGLAIVKHIILQHGGGIRAESTLGEGTSIIFTLPVG
jgi:two-component system phosphate regulon sensor histidine kinase PhoR